MTTHSSSTHLADAKLVMPLAAVVGATSPLQAGVAFDHPFAPVAGLVHPVERPQRDELCLNGLWQFQPVAVPPDHKRHLGNAPTLTDAEPDAWSPVPIRIPSHWNANRWGNGRDVGEGTDKPYRADSVYFPSYPHEWDRVEMGWLRRTFRVPEGWGDQRIVLHFEAIAGDARVIVNGHDVGGHFDNYIPLDLDVTDVVDRDGDNELLVGVRGAPLFDLYGPRYPRMKTTYAPGSYTDGLIGIWQDVYLRAVPAVRVDDVFVKPQVADGVLEVEVMLCNDTDQTQHVELSGDVRPWINLAPQDDVLLAPVPKSRLDDPVLDLVAQQVTLQPGERTQVTLRKPVRNELNTWSPGEPNLYGLVLQLRDQHRTIDTRYTRFGWRQFTIDGKRFLLNGEPIQCFGDMVHPFALDMMSPRYACLWYRMVFDMNCNAVRPHGQPFPRYYYDLADEMGMLVLDESALYGSSIKLNFTPDVAWERFMSHTEGLVRRDRNHPSVMGWSIGNELFATFIYSNVTQEETDLWYDRLTAIGRRVTELDPTRPWVSCDGDEDLRGTLPVWCKHFGHGTPTDKLPLDMNKPMMIGESGGTYYCKPIQLAEFNGDRAYESYAGRNEALAIDLYDNIAKMALPHLTYFAACQTVWYGLEPLGMGYDDLDRLPNLDDGVFFTQPYREGTPGMQPERIPPFTTMLNPGYDPSLPAYVPLAMFEATKAALEPGGPAACPWDHVSAQPAPTPAPPPEPTITSVAFVGDATGPVRSGLNQLGVPLSEAERAGMLIVDLSGVSSSDTDRAKRAMNDTLNADGVVLVIVNGPISDAIAGELLPKPLTVTDRTATMLVRRVDDDPWTSELRVKDLYFAEDQVDRYVLKRGLAGPLVGASHVVLEASNTDWSQFNDVTEDAKCAATVIYEKVHKPSGATLVSVPVARGRLYVTSIDVTSDSIDMFILWRRVLAYAGVKLNPPVMAWLRPTAVVAGDDPAAWRYTIEQPADGWSDEAFDDSSWQQGPGGFGRDVPNTRPRSAWTTHNIWLRGVVTLSEDDVKHSGELRLVLHHDDAIRVFVNGRLAHENEGHLRQYQAMPFKPSVREGLYVGDNVIAIHCRQAAGGQYIDLGVARGPVMPSVLRPDEREHDLLLDGPRND